MREEDRKTIRLLTCDTAQEANLIQGHLANEGIPSIITNENFTTLAPHMNGMMGAGIQILVEESDYERAYDLVVRPKEEAEMIHCPNCHSKNVVYGLGKKKRSKFMFVLLSLLFMLPLGNIRNTFYCKDCKEDFKR